MEGLIIIVAVTALLGFILWISDRRHRPSDDTASRQVVKEEKEEVEEKEGAGEECCGMHIVCEKDSLVTFTDQIEYYDDEELDRFSGKDAGDYEDGEIEEWRDVLLTLRPEEIAGWARSVRLRGLVMPSAIRDELIMIVEEVRSESVGKEK